MRSACTKLLRHGWRTVLSRPSAFTVGALALLCCFGWTARSFAGTCTPPVIDGNIDDLKTYAACIGANHQGCGLDGTDQQDICKFDDSIVPCATQTACVTSLGRPGINAALYFINGFDVREGVLAYNSLSHELFLGYRVSGSIGDSDGDGTPGQGTLCPPGANIVDPAGISDPTESYEWYIDTNCDGIHDFVVAVSGSPTSPTVKVTDDASPRNPILGATGTAAYVLGGSDIEVKVTGLTLPPVFRFTGFVGSRVDGLGEDAFGPLQCTPEPAIDIQKTASPERLCPDASTTFTLTVANAGDAPLTNVRVTDDLPAGLSYVPGSTGGSCGVGEPTVSQTGLHLTWPALSGSFDVGRSCTITFQARRGSTCFGGVINNSQVLGDFQSPCLNGGATRTVIDTSSFKLVCVEGPCVRVDCSPSPAEACPGTPITLTATATNCQTGAGSTEDITITVNGVPMTFNGVPAGETRTFSQTVTMPECTSGSNVPFTVSASGHTAECGDSQPINSTCQVLCRKPEVKIEKTGLATASPGTTFTYTLKVTNIGNVPLERIHVTDDICPQAQYQDHATPAPTSEPLVGNLDGQVVWDVPGPLAPNGVLTFTFDVKIPDDFDCTTNTSCVNNADVTAFCANAQATSHASFTTSIVCGGKCWLTGGGQSFDSDGHLHSYGGVVNPGCSPTAGGGGNWNDLDHTTGAHFKGQNIVVDRCGNVPGIPPGSTSPKTPVNFIEFHGTGTFVSGHGNKRVDVCFNGHYEDRAEPGSLGQTDPNAKDRYFLRVYTNCNDPVGSTVLLVDVDGNPGTQDPATIFHGNLQIHISGCDKAPKPGQLPQLDDPAVDPMIDVSPLPTELSFGLPRPNPTGAGMTLQYSLPKDALVSAKVFDVAGRVVRDLGDGPVGAGVHMLSWNLQDDSGQRVSPGLFFVRLSVDGQVQMRHVTVLP